MVDSFNISMSEVLPGDIVELRMKGGGRDATVKVGPKSWATCIVSPQGKNYPDTVWGVVAILEEQVGAGKSVDDLEEFQDPTDRHGELYRKEFVNDSSKDLSEVLPGPGEMEETYQGEIKESRVADNYALDTLKVVDGYEVDVVRDVRDILDDSVRSITPQLKDLSWEELLEVEAAEDAGKTRKSLMKVIQEEKDSRTEGGG